MFGTFSVVQKGLDKQTIHTATKDLPTTRDTVLFAGK